MTETSFLFIPDISGFTEFVTGVESEHSQHIISELLELIIDSNELGLSVAEVEGDAVFFYKKGDVPSVPEVIKQVKKTFIDFNNHLRLYEHRRICGCGACSGAVNLSLKFVVHTGEISMVSVKDRVKPFGEPVITIHRLLKNKIPDDEYVMVTDDYLNKWGDEETVGDTLGNWEKGNDCYDKIGNVKYNFLRLSPLKDMAFHGPTPIESLKFQHPLVFEETINARKDIVFELVSNLNYRHLWTKGVDAMEFDKEKLNRVGTKHICVIGDRRLEFETVTSNFGNDQLVLGERTQSIPLVRESIAYYILEGEDDVTKLRIEIHFKPRKFIGWLLNPIFKRFMIKSFKQGITLLKEVAEKSRSVIPEPIIAD
ncbi:DUF2652 domain-containing protein [Puteibacter caeruleilacunae]|nr:DUF2652 domain-containing protein [Puteibacter caeruleilacunae]